jgi:hypothetical protein
MLVRASKPFYRLMFMASGTANTAAERRKADATPWVPAGAMSNMRLEPTLPQWSLRQFCVGVRVGSDKSDRVLLWWVLNLSSFCAAGAVGGTMA